MTSSTRSGDWDIREYSSAVPHFDDPWSSEPMSDHEQAVDSTSEHSADPTQTCTKCDSIDTTDADPSDNSLRARSRLADEKFYSTPASTCTVPFRVQIRLLRAALRLAQETLWNALREHWPRIQRSIYPEGPEEIKFGREELYRGFVNETYPSEANELCGHPRASVIHYVFDVVLLRNAVCHPSHHSTRDVDRHIQRAQALAVVLRDENEAFKMRRLRNELQAKAEEAYEEIERYVGVASLPFAKPWPVYLQRFFDTVRFDVNFGERSEYPEVVKRAAKEWQLKYIHPGELDPRYLANVERAKSFMRSTEHGRRASVSVMPRGGADIIADIERPAIVQTECEPVDERTP